ALVFLSTKSKNRFLLWLGAILGFTLVDGLSVVFGSFAGEFLPLKAVKFVSALAFLFFGVVMLRGGSGVVEKKIVQGSPLVASFLLIAASEFGDKTQVAAGVFAANNNPYLVFAGSISSLALLSAAAVWFGKKLGDRVNREKIGYISGAVFIVLGVGVFLF
ncbi:MAG: TMEM165/GDT1 family protein, partial [Candidatus Altiarchaeota archaeon]|nr:TMEM165/GDT1 family protein [Candidatus Altiarchaeota archaeon]